MKIALLSTSTFLVSLFAHTTAYVSLNPFPLVVDVGETYTLSWTATANYTYDVWLIRAKPENPYTWDKISSLAEGLLFNSLGGSYDWTVPSNLSTQREYGLWLDSFPQHFNGEQFINQTEWFEISSYTSPTTSASASATPSATSSATSGGVSSTSTSETSSRNSSTVHHNSLSGGAIAGIVIGCILALAVLAGAVLLHRRRRRKAEFESREAAARANRLAPVMQESSATDFEMSNRSPQANKETNV